MSILIKGVEIPKESWDCPCHDGETGRCKVTGHSCYDIPKDCPLVEVNDDAEPAHAVEAVHGEWVDGYKRQSCSACHYRGMRSWNYCPNCGAKMDGEK